MTHIASKEPGETIVANISNKLKPAMRGIARWLPLVLASLCLMLSVPSNWQKAHRAWFSDEPFYSLTIPWSAQTQKIVTRRYESSQEFSKTALAIVASIWGIFFLGKKQVDQFTNGWAERLAILAVTCLLVISIYYGLRYTNALMAEEMRAERLTSRDNIPSVIPNILDAKYSKWYSAQVFFLVSSVFILASAIVTDMWILREGKSPSSINTNTN
ncbi:hypothetical protein K227x_63920 [Rubripirellula lacrimiformis]|uniref:Uncharacterized protein n=1 Tax=Rubripirellula lacrimiformis TaxID=1930273 RepID=A0A517NLF8_9BACT|nr:hypothetical protein [Rubripirellula lacrimiformis]QDT07962.1 hypothetical protein K227x_63920 [Rubripirellula lacrimiformis]